MIAKHLAQILPVSLCVFFMYEPGKDELVARHGSGNGAEVVRGLRLAVGHHLSGWVAASRQSIHNSDPILDLGNKIEEIHPRLRSCLSTPLAVDEHLVGVLSLYSTSTDAFTSGHCKFVEAVAKLASRVLWSVSTSVESLQSVEAGSVQ